LNLYGRDFGAIASILPTRSRYQIRTHYAYLAKSILSNFSQEKPGRRIKTRGRPPKQSHDFVPGSYNVKSPDPLLLELTNCIRKLENQK